MRAVRKGLLRVAGWLSRVALRIGDAPTREMPIESAASRLVAKRRRPRVLEEAPEGYVAMTPRGQLPSPMGSAVIVASEEAGVFVPVFVGPSEALALRLRLEGETFTRPLTHDLIDRLLAMMQAKVVEVRIEELRGTVFIATIVVRVGEEDTEIDARASDAVIVAVGHGLAVLVSQAVIESAGRPLDGLSGGP